jgi:transcriptional regulator with GAF, ATPase, and Fis domain
MLQFDRYLVGRARALDLATGSPVDILRVKSDQPALSIFQSRYSRTLIDLDCVSDQRVEIWERWLPRSRPKDLPQRLESFIELLECGRAGAPRAFDLGDPQRSTIDYLKRVFAREARIRGWLPIDVDLLAANCGDRRKQWPAWLTDRSLVIFAGIPGLSGDAVLALLRVARRDLRPHVLIRTLRHRDLPPWPVAGFDLDPPVVHETATPFGAAQQQDSVGEPALTAESAARWALLIEESVRGNGRWRRVIDLADVLASRHQPFEARALVESVPREHPERTGRGASVLARIAGKAAARAACMLDGTAERARGWEVMDDFVAVLQLCQDVEDEQVALSRIAAYLRERLQASTVGFVAQRAGEARVLARVGSEIAAVDLAMRSIDTGIAIRPVSAHGSTECACPIRHAADVIGALWCRWPAGTPVASDQAATLLGIAAAAAAPSVRVALAKLQPTGHQSNPVPELVGDSVAIVAVREAIVRAAASPFPVVIEGESGSGKELAARAIHTRSGRRERRFCPINCAALVDDLVEAELFGYTRGAFTGASTDRAGVFEEASGGTLFLDEVVELRPRVQAKLLRTLQEGEIRRLGETNLRRVDVRVVAATNRPLAKEVELGTFRADLWYRLDVIRIALPPLRQRLEDLPVLVGHLWQTLAARTGSRAALASTTLGALAFYDWPGNIRELQNVLASLMVAAPRAGLIHPSSLPAHLARVAAFSRAATLADARRQFEERFVRAALARAGGRSAVAARELGISRQGLAKLMSRLGMVDRAPQIVEAANVQ